MCLLAFLMTTRNFKGFKRPRTPKGAWLGSYQPNWHNHKIAISPTAKIGSTPNLDRVVEIFTSLVVQNDKIQIQDDGRPPYWKLLEML